MSINIVIKQADPPIKLEIGSAINTPAIFNPNNLGRISVSGITIMAFLNKEKNIACLDFPSPTNTDCPAN